MSPETNNPGSTAMINALRPPRTEPLRADPILAETIPDGPIEESVPALLGLRRFITAARLAWSNETADTLQDSIPVKQEVARAVQAGQLPASGLEPRNFWERRAYMRASNIRAKTVNAASERIRLSAAFGRTDSMGRPFMVHDPDKTLSTPGRPEYAHRMRPDGSMEVYVKYADDVEETMLDRPFAVRDGFGKLPFGSASPRPHDLGTKHQIDRLNSGNYSRKEKRAELTAARKYAKQDRVEKRNARKLNAMIDGRSLDGAISGKRADFANNKVNKHRERLEELRRLQPLYERKVADRKQKRREFKDWYVSELKRGVGQVKDYGRDVKGAHSAWVDEQVRGRIQDSFLKLEHSDDD